MHFPRICLPGAYGAARLSSGGGRSSSGKRSEMAVIELDITELSDVVDVLQDRGIEYAISYEPGVAYLYGTDDTIQQIRDILWASQVVDEWDMVCGDAQFEEIGLSLLRDN